MLLAKTYATGRASDIEILMLVLEFKVDCRMKTFKGIAVECMECLNKDLQRKM